MSLLEAAIPLLLLPAVLGLFLPAHRRPRWLAFAPFAALFLALLHAVIEGYRWQMVPVFALAALLCLLNLRTARSGPPAAPTPRPWYRAAPRVAGALLLLMVFTVAAGLPWALPMFDLPQPSGEHAVGTTTLHMLDESRPELFTEDPNDRRELMLQAWYPASSPAPGAQPESAWGSDLRRRMVAQSLKMPGFVFDHLAAIPTHSYPEATIAGQGAYPVLIFSHGYAQGFTGQNTVLMEELASHGYIVFSIGHPHESSSVIYPDGRAVGLNPALVQKLRDESKKIPPDLIDKFKASTDKAERARIVRQYLGAGGLLTASVHLWTADTKFALNQLETLNASGSGSPFSQRLDLSRIGVLGMSFGGATAGQVCLDDARVKAGVNLDGGQYGDMLERPVQKPFMFMHNSDAKLINEQMFDTAAGPAWYIVVKDSQHFDFTDFPLVAPVFKLLGALGKIEGARAVQITNAYTLAFFDQALKNQPAPLLAGESKDYPEVEFASRNYGATK